MQVESNLCLFLEDKLTEETCAGCGVTLSFTGLGLGPVDWIDGWKIPECLPRSDLSLAD